MRIKDSALVAAAVLSNRYIADRFLPDKAIDLIDEAAAKLRTEIDSMPAELDEASRRMMQLEIEREALRKESDAASKQRLERIEKELADLREEADSLKARWQVEKAQLDRVRALKEQIDAVRREIELAERQYDLNRVAELRYGKLAELERQLAALPSTAEQNGKAQRLVKEEVDEEDIAEVVSRWTGIPVSKLLESEKQKLLHLADELHPDLGTGKEQKVTITATSNLSKDDIERMVRDAAAHAEEDRRKREEAEIRNEASSLIYATEKSLKEVGDEIDAPAREGVEAALAELKRVEANGTAAEIKAAVEKLQQASYKMSEALYQATAAQGNGASGGGNGASAGGNGQQGAGAASGARTGGGSGEDVIDAEFKET